MKKRILSILLVVTMLAVMVPTFAVASGAETTVTDWDAEVITLYTADDFKAFHDKCVAQKSFVGQTVKLGADIDMSGNALSKYTGDTYGFNGTFDGQFHTLSNVSVSETVYHYTGALFGSISAANSAVIKNLAVISSAFTHGRYSGVLYGDAHGALTVENVYLDVDMTVPDPYEVGGFVGRTDDDASSITFINCVFDGSIQANNSGRKFSPFMGLVNKGAVFSFTNCLIYGDFTRSYGNSVWTSAGKFICTNNSSADITYNDCIQYNDYYRIGEGMATAVCPELAGIDSGFGAFDTIAAEDVPAGYTTLNTDYPVPTTLLPFFADKVNAVAAENGVTTEYYGYQDNGDMSAIRLIGLVHGDNEAFTSVGFEIEAVGPTGVTASFTDDVKSVYTSVETPTGTKTAADLRADYIFVTEIGGIKANSGVATFAVKTYSVDADGNKTYTDMYVVSFDTTVAAE